MVLAPEYDRGVYDDQKLSADRARGQTARLLYLGLQYHPSDCTTPTTVGHYCIPMSSILHGSILPSPNQELQQPFTGDEISIRVPTHATRFFSPFFPSYHLISLPNDISEVSPTPTLPLLSLNVLLFSAWNCRQLTHLTRFALICTHAL